VQTVLTEGRDISGSRAAVQAEVRHLFASFRRRVLPTRSADRLGVVLVWHTKKFRLEVACTVNLELSNHGNMLFWLSFGWHNRPVVTVRWLKEMMEFEIVVDTDGARAKMTRRDLGHHVHFVTSICTAHFAQLQSSEVPEASWKKEVLASELAILFAWVAPIQVCTGFVGQKVQPFCCKAAMPGG
jgi:hypothetical protein